MTVDLVFQVKEGGNTNLISPSKEEGKYLTSWISMSKLMDEISYLGIFLVLVIQCLHNIPTYREGNGVKDNVEMVYPTKLATCTKDCKAILEDIEVFKRVQGVFQRKIGDVSERSTIAQMPSSKFDNISTLSYKT
jgi:hypothetical protein